MDNIDSICYLYTEYDAWLFFYWSLTADIVLTVSSVEIEQSIAIENIHLMSH